MYIEQGGRVLDGSQDQGGQSRRQLRTKQSTLINKV